MLNPILLGSILLAAGPARETLAPPDLAAYEAAKASAGRDAQAQVRLALWCEAHGLQAERIRHLALAVLTDPKNALARGLMGLVEYRGRWQRPDAVERKVKDDAEFAAVLAEYNERRAKAANTVDDQWALVLWCEKNGLTAEATAHASAVVRLDPTREAAWKRLGYKRHGHRWMTDAQVADEKAEAERQKLADRSWKPRLEKWRDGLDSKSQAKRAEAEAALAEITDPRAVPMLGTVFGTGGAERQAVAVRVLGQIDAPGASQALAILAVFGKSAEVRRTATETLRRRDVREFGGMLVGMMRRPIKYKVQPVGGPGVPGGLLVEGQRKNLLRQYAPPPPPRINNVPPGVDLYTYDPLTGLPVIVRGSGLSGYVGPDGYAVTNRGAGTLAVSAPGVNAAFGPGALGIVQRQQNAFGASNPFGAPWGAVAGNAMIWGYYHGRPEQGNTIEIGQANLETQRAAMAAQQQLESDVSAIDRANAKSSELNGRLGQVLNDATGQALSPDPEAWEPWWSDQLGYSQRAAYDDSKPTVVQVISPQLPPVAGFPDNSNGYIRRVSCFGAGTLVHTLAGVRPIESLAVGDRVLTQDIRTGALGYKPILVVHRNPPSKTFRITRDGETIVSSYFHRFWKAGRGWVMARDLSAGDTVRTLNGLVRVGTIDEGRVEPVFNLDVAEDADFFVGKQGALVHDNTLPDRRLIPFDAPPSLAAAR